MSDRGKVAALLAAVFLAAFAGAVAAVWMLGSFGTGNTNWGDVATWVAGIATFLTATVAVTPILLEARRRRDVAALLRSRILDRLLLIRGVLDRSVKELVETQEKVDPLGPVPESVRLVPDVRSEVLALERMLGDIHLLQPDEIVGLDRVGTLLRLYEFASVGGRQWSTDGVMRVLEAIAPAMSALHSHHSTWSPVRPTESARSPRKS
jgi:hypothetical protein